jgi:hypothetical protein
MIAACSSCLYCSNCYYRLPNSFVPITPGGGGSNIHYKHQLVKEQQMIQTSIREWFARPTDYLHAVDTGMASAAINF